MTFKLVDRRRYYMLILTPTFIGSGKSYKEFETLVSGTSIYVFDTNLLLEELLRRGVLPVDIFSEVSKSSRDRESRILQEVKSYLINRDGSYYRVELHSSRQGRVRGYEVKLFIKTKGRPFIPGSSLKGFFRTALLYDWMERNLEDARDSLERVPKERKKADDLLEESAFAVNLSLPSSKMPPTSNREYLRCLKVTDSKPLDLESLLATEVSIFFAEGNNLPIYYEALKPLSLTEFEISIDPLVVFDHRLSFGTLLSVSNKFSRSIIEVEKKRMREVPKRFWDALLRLSEKATLLRIGGNTGWYSHTVGILLKSKLRDIFGELREEFKLGKHPRKDKLSVNFPRTYRLAAYNGFKMPLGWVAICEDKATLDKLAREWSKEVLREGNWREIKKDIQTTFRGSEAPRDRFSRAGGFSIGDIIDIDKLKEDMGKRRGH